MRRRVDSHLPQLYKSGLKVHEFSGASEDKIKGATAQFK